MGAGSKTYVPYYIGLTAIYWIQAFVAVYLVMGPGQFCGPVCPLTWAQKHIAFVRSQTYATSGVMHNVTRQDLSPEVGILRYDLLQCGEAARFEHWDSFHLKEFGVKGEGRETEYKWRAKFETGAPHLATMSAAQEGLVSHEDVMKMGKSKKLAWQQYETYLECQSADGEGCEPCDGGECPHYGNKPWRYKMFDDSNVMLGGMTKSSWQKWMQAIQQTQISSTFCLQCEKLNVTTLWEPCQTKAECVNDIMPGFKRSTTVMPGYNLTLRAQVMTFFLTILICFIIQGLGAATLLVGMVVFAPKTNENFKKLSRTESCLGVFVKVFPRCNRLVNALLLLLAVMAFFLIHFYHVCDDAIDPATSAYPFKPASEIYVIMVIFLYGVTCMGTSCFRVHSTMDTAFMNIGTQKNLKEMEKDLAFSLFNPRRCVPSFIKTAFSWYNRTGP